MAQAAALSERCGTFCDASLALGMTNQCTGKSATLLYCIALHHPGQL